jgi:hypothetical protein
MVVLLVSGLVMAACGGNVVVDTTTTKSGTGGTGGSGGSAGTAMGTGGTVFGTSGGGGGPTSPCHTCACGLLMSEGGCADICDENLNGTNTPNFCQGAPPLAQCTNCILMLCGSTPDQCH